MKKYLYEVIIIMGEEHSMLAKSHCYAEAMISKSIGYDNSNRCNYQHPICCWYLTDIAMPHPKLSASFLFSFFERANIALVWEHVKVHKLIFNSSLNPP